LDGSQIRRWVMARLPGAKSREHTPPWEWYAKADLQTRILFYLAVRVHRCVEEFLHMFNCPPAFRSTEEVLTKY
jgi:hypothetical protein